jgi:hypothetical protein
MIAQSGEYTDAQTGMRITIETEHPYDPDWPRITVYPPEQCMLTSEEMMEAVKRLVRKAGYDEALHEWVERKS